MRAIVQGPRSKVQGPISASNQLWTLDVGLNSSPNLIHRPLRPHEVGRVDAVAGLFGADAVADQLGQFVIGAVAAEQRPRIPLDGGEQAVANLPFGRQTKAVAILA